MSEFVALRVRAVLAAGIASLAPWGIALDGLLAAQLHEGDQTARRDAGEELVRAREQAKPPDLDLPLARCTPEQGPWHWAATTAWPEAHGDVIDVHHWSARVDHRHLEHVAEQLPRVISQRQGRYRAKRMPLLVTPTPAITWHGVGDIEQIGALLESVISIGKKRSTGEGHVLTWTVEPAPDLDQQAAAHLHPDGSLGRPVPTACVEMFETPVHHGGTGQAGVRPPYMHPARTHDLVLPAATGQDQP